MMEIQIVTIDGYEKEFRFEDAEIAERFAKKFVAEGLATGYSIEYSFEKEGA